MNMYSYKDVFKRADTDEETIYQKFLAKDLILRDYLAIERTILTNQATFLAYIRTSLTMMVVGVTLFQLALKSMQLQYLGIFIAVLGFFVFVYGMWESWKMKKKINLFLQKKQEVESIIKETV
jgi:putative membrane protein